MAALSARARHASLARGAGAAPKAPAGGFGFLSDEDAARDALLEANAPPPMYGLTASQMRGMGLCGPQDDTATRLHLPPEEVITASASYATECGMARATEMVGGGGTMGGGGFGPASQAPPDLPSMLLDSRIVYIGMQLVPSVTELVIAQLLWLQYDKPEKPVYIYINSEGSQNMEGQSVGFETEASAIADTMNYIKPEIHTIGIGRAYGQAAMILARGSKGKRFALPHAQIKLIAPTMNQTVGSVSEVKIKADETEANAEVYYQSIATNTGQPLEKVREDVSRPFYLTPEAAVEYGLIDKVLKDRASLMEKKDLDMLLAQASQNAQKGIITPSGR